MISNNASLGRSRIGRLGFRMALGLAATHTVQAAPPEEPVRTQARALAAAGVEAYAVNDFQTASAKLDESFRLASVPTLGLWSARALVKLGKWVEAENRYRLVSELEVSPSDSAVQRTAQDEAASERTELLLRIPSVVLDLDSGVADQVTFTLDGVLVQRGDIGQRRPIDPGRHVYAGQRGSVREEVIFKISEGEHKQISLVFQPETFAARSAPAAVGAAASEDWQIDQTNTTLRTAGWVALGAGGVSLLTGSIAYIAGRRQYSDLERRALCVNADCPQSEVDAYNTWRAVHVGGLVTGGVLAAAGLGVILATRSADDGSEPRASVSLRIEPTRWVVGGQF